MPAHRDARLGAGHSIDSLMVHLFTGGPSGRTRDRRLAASSIQGGGEEPKLPTPSSRDQTQAPGTGVRGPRIFVAENHDREAHVDDHAAIVLTFLPGNCVGAYAQASPPYKVHSEACGEASAWSLALPTNASLPLLLRHCIDGVIYSILFDDAARAYVLESSVKAPEPCDVMLGSNSPAIATERRPDGRLQLARSPEVCELVRALAAACQRG
jgi:hypothetical protein